MKTYKVNPKYFDEIIKVFGDIVESKITDYKIKLEEAELTNHPASYLSFFRDETGKVLKVVQIGNDVELNWLYKMLFDSVNEAVEQVVQ